jgi:hypothetical protein
MQDPDPHPDPFVRGMDSRVQIRIRIHTIMSWIPKHCRELILESECRHPSSLGDLNNTEYDDDLPLRDSSLLLQGKRSLILTIPVNIVVIFYKSV